MKSYYSSPLIQGSKREMKNCCTATIFTYKEIKAATNNFKDVLGTGGFGSVYLGKLSDGKLVAVKVRLDKTQLGADSFINEVYFLPAAVSDFYQCFLLTF